MRTPVLPRVARLARPRGGAGLTRPILGAFAIVLVVVTGMFALQLLGARRQHDVGQSARHAEQVLRVSNALERRVIDLETGVRGYLLTGQEDYLGPYLQARDAIPGRVAELVALARVPVQDRRARRLRELIDAYMRSYAAPLHADGLVMTRGEVLAASAQGMRKMDAIRAEFAAFNAAEQELATSRRERWDARAHGTTVLGAAGLVFSALLLFALAAYLRSRVLRPVRRVALAAGELADGRLDVRVPVEGSGEIATLAGAFNGMAGALTEVLEQLRSTARTDPLTGLANRRAWDDKLARELARSRRYDGRLCLALLDLDHFKRFNDARGHQAGDKLLQDAARAWSALLRPTDTLARYGGEEFSLLLPHCDTETAEAIVARLLDAVPAGQTASCGIAEWDAGESAETLTARADAALYMAKRGGRAQAVLV